jgi:hypothetical protein
VNGGGPCIESCSGGYYNERTTKYITTYLKILSRHGMDEVRKAKQRTLRNTWRDAPKKQNNAPSIGF